MARLRRCFLFVLSLCFWTPLLNSAPQGSRTIADDGLQTAFQRALYAVDSVAGGFEASNPAQRLSTRFTQTGALVQHGDSSVGLRMSGYGYGERLVHPAAPRLAGSGNRVEYVRGGLTEWYVNSPEGVEQGFTLSGAAWVGCAGRAAHDRAGGDGPYAPGIVAGRRRGDAGIRRNRAVALCGPAGVGRHRPGVGCAAGGAGPGGAPDGRGRWREYPLTVDPLIQQAKLTASDGVADDYFGWSVAVGGDTAVIGAIHQAGYRGAAYVFVRSGVAWSQQAKLTASDGVVDDLFGWSVAVSGDTAVIGARGKASSRGAAYVFVRSGATWSQQATLTASDGVANDVFGWSVALSGDTVVIGARDKASSQGAAYVFVRGAGAWTEQAKLTASDGATNDYFGGSVAVSGDTAAIGASGKEGARGAAYVFTRNGVAWSQQAKLTASDSAANDYFGKSVALSGDTAVIGAEGEGDWEEAFQGAAYVFVRGGVAWSQQAKLTASDRAQFDRFGGSVALSGDTAVIGAPGKASSRGAAYAFVRSGAAWSQHATLTASDGADSDRFGESVAVSGDTAVIGAYHLTQGTGRPGAAYVFLHPSVTVASVPPGTQFAASGTDCPSGTLTTPYTVPGGCTIAFVSPAQNSAGNARYTFRQWHDGLTSNPRSFPALTQSAAFTALFNTEYLLTTAAGPPSGGQVTGSGWYADSANATVAAIPNPGYLFTGFSEDLGGSATPQTLWMNGPKSVTGAFIPMPGAVMSALISSKSGPKNLRQWTITLRNAGPGVAYAPQIHGLMLTQTYGAACSPLRSSPTAFPLVFASMPAGNSHVGSALFDFSACPANARFTVVVVFTANSGSSGGSTTLANQTM